MSSPPASLEPIPPGAWLGIAVGAYLPLTLGSIGFIIWRYGAAVAWTRMVGTDPVRDVLLGLGAGALMIVLTAGLVRWTRWGAAMVESFARLLGGMPVHVAVALAIASSIGEEALFRAALQPEIGFIAATLIFGFIHLPLEPEMRPWPLLAAAAGALLGGLYIWTGAALAPIMAHFTVNAVHLIRLGQRPPQTTSSP